MWRPPPPAQRGRLCLCLMDDNSAAREGRRASGVTRLRGDASGKETEQGSTPARARGAPDGGLRPACPEPEFSSRKEPQTSVDPAPSHFPVEETGARGGKWLRVTRAVCLPLGSGFFLSQVLSFLRLFSPPTNTIQCGCRHICRRRGAPHKAWLHLRHSGAVR